MRYISHGRIMHPRSRQTLDTLQHFLATPLANCLTSAHNGEAAAVCDVDAYRALPLMTKQNYMLAYPLAERCRYGALHACDMLAMSSGSTGIPTVWPRTVAHELDITFRFEQVFHACRAHERSTLAVVCFARGAWVGGMFTTACCRHLAMKGYPLTVVTPGNKKEEIFRVVEELGPQYELIVLLGYPPFIKDVIDSVGTQHIDWPRYKPKLVFAGEVFGEARLPTLVQYDPRSRYFEVRDDDTLVVSGDSGVPLMRYHIADKGGII